MNEHELRRRIDELTGRVARLEARLDDQPQTPESEPEPLPPVPRPAPPLTPPVSPEREPATPAVAPTVPEPPKRHEPRPAASLELLVGGKWMAWVGAVAIVVAVGFFLKLAYDQGWWARLAPITRCLIGAGFGSMLLVAGEIAWRRVGRAASAGLFAAGVGVLYLDAFSTFRFFDLLPEEGAFALMGLVAVLGFAITLRTRTLAIGVLSLLVGYATPVLLHEQSDRDLELLGYLTMLLGIALGLSAGAPRPFRVLRYVTLGLHAIIALIWLLTDGAAHWLMAVVFMSIWWVMMLAECTLAALRDQSPRGNVVATLLATAAYVTAGTWIIAAGTPAGGLDWLGAFTLAVAVLGATVAFNFGPGLDGLRGRFLNAMDKLAIALWAQSGILLAVAIALHFDGYGQAIGWLAVALAAVELSRGLPSRGVGWFGIIVGALAVGRIAVFDSWAEPALRTVLVDFPWVDLTGWGVLALVAVASMHVAARRLMWPLTPTILAGLATIGWLAVAQIECERSAVTITWLVAVAALLACERLGRRQHYFEIALGALTVTASAWLGVDMLSTRFERGWDATSTLPLFNIQMVIGVAIAACAVWAGLIMRRRARMSQPSALASPLSMQIAFIVGILVLLVGLTFQIDHTLARFVGDSVWPSMQLRGLCWTGLWALGALGTFVIGRGSRWHLLVGTGWLLTCLSAFAWLWYDTLGHRFAEGAVDVMPVLNLQFAIGLLCAAVIAIEGRILRAASIQEDLPEQWGLGMRQVGLALLAAIGLWLGSLEIDRALAAEPMAVQTGLSVYWSLFAVVLILVGFARRSRAARYIGLALLSLTVLKVLFVDLSQIEQIWRVASFLVSGLLLLATSVVYSRLAPRLLAE